MGAGQVYKYMRIYLWSALTLQALGADFTDTRPVVRLRMHSGRGEMQALGLLGCISNVPFDTVSLVKKRKKSAVNKPGWWL